jgi:hypothetical protein
MPLTLKHRECCLTRRSSGPTTAGHTARTPQWFILHRAGGVARRAGPLSFTLGVRINVLPMPKPSTRNPETEPYGFVYFLGHASTGPVKVGFTSKMDVKSRLRQLQTGNPERLDVLGTVHV